MINFQVPGAIRAIQCNALGPYRRYWLDREKTQRNPLFDEHCSCILSLKDTSNRDFGRAVKFFTDRLVPMFKQAQNLPASELLIVPSSTAGKVPPGIEKIVEAICAADKRFTYRKGAFQRIKTISKLARGGDRSMSIQLASLRYDDHKRAPLNKWIFDDVSTTGHSLAACAQLIHAETPRAVVRAMVLGKTVDD